MLDKKSIPMIIFRHYDAFLIEQKTNFDQFIFFKPSPAKM